MTEPSTTAPPAPPATPRQKLTSLLVVYLRAIQHTPGCDEAEYHTAEELIIELTTRR